MSGRGVVRILEPHGDVYITGSTVVRHKVGDDGRELDFFPSGYDVQLVLTAKHVYKLLQRHPPPPPPSSSSSSSRPVDSKRADGEADELQRQQQREREGACNTQPPPPAPPPEVMWRESLGLVRAVVPLHNHPARVWAAERNEAGANCHGFAIEYFSTRKKGPKPSAQRTLLQRYMAEVQCRCVDDVFTEVQVTAPDGTPGGLRVREFHVGLVRPPWSAGVPHVPSEGSPFLEQEWCCLFREARMNYWHERLEDSLIAEPEVFQYQVYAMEFPRAATSTAAGARREQQPLLCQLVLSTERLYAVPRHNAKLLAVELPLHHSEMHSRWFTVAAMQSISCNSLTGVIVCTGYQQHDGQQQQEEDSRVRRGLTHVNSAAEPGKAVTLTLGFFSVAEAEEAVVEIQRVWELTHRHADFPLA
ncbi:uncharacterized protein Tco025E_00912 [Trypanosoma conorhini]|uniref:Uncharacterized protein n=1 Tax=Trypanosoma conorhini TaxID=83891 RepID=A0A422QA35_9TRYP|nr:uncharacterized protein Tco025E_00912 [Trypanosoma conorhini]RNF26830.1 hypothetical protein Tco025E_00912 [Trypanosoma conorhini]